MGKGQRSRGLGDLGEEVTDRPGLGGAWRDWAPRTQVETLGFGSLCLRLEEGSKAGYR